MSELITPEYECDKCGACCKGFVIEITATDILREPKLKDVAASFMGNNDDIWDIRDKYLLATPYKPCPMLDVNNLCTIYNTRPNVCVHFKAGHNKCQDVRLQLGLPVLKAKNLKDEKNKFQLDDVPVWELSAELNRRLDRRPVEGSK
jgi:uncharacterized protein